MISLEVIFVKIEEFLLKNTTNKKTIIGVAGGPGVGKSVFCSRLAEYIDVAQNKKTFILEIDNFLFSEKHRKKFNLPKTYPYSINHKLLVEVINKLIKNERNVEIPVYNKKTKDKDESKMVENIGYDYIMIDGLSAISKSPECANVYSLLDLAIYIDADFNNIKHWWLHRASLEHQHGIINTRTPEQALEKWETSCAVELKNCVIPSKKNADIIIFKDNIDEYNNVLYINRFNTFTNK